MISLTKKKVKISMSKQKIPHVIIDTREQKLIDLCEKNKDSMTFEVKQLDVGDIVCSSKVGIERKEGSDFLVSLTDGRLFDQLERLLSAYESPILILEGFNDDVLSNTGIRIKSIYGALAKITYTMGVFLIPTRNLEDTYVAIERIAFREQIKQKASITSRSVPKNMTVEERRAFIIEGLLDIGPKKAQALIEAFETPYAAFKAIKKTRILFTRTGNPKGIEGAFSDADLKGFGWKFIKKNKKLLFNIKESTQKEKNDEKGKQKTLF